MSYTYPHLNQLIKRAASYADQVLAVIYPCESVALHASLDVAKRAMARVILVGPAAHIAALAHADGVDLSQVEIINTPDDPVAAAEVAARLVIDGHAQILMKGSLHTDQLMGVLVNRSAGLRTDRRISHAFVFDLPDIDHPLLMTDCVVNIEPDLLVKRDIVQNAIDLAHALGNPRPLVGILSATESVNPAIRGTVDAAALCKMAQRGQITGGELDGPLAFDNAISAECARTKNITSTVAGHPDILLVPNLETGNTLYKSFVHFGHAQCAGLVLGTRVPVVLTSRADSEFCRLASVALGILVARHEQAMLAA